VKCAAGPAIPEREAAKAALGVDDLSGATNYAFQLAYPTASKSPISNSNGACAQAWLRLKSMIQQMRNEVANDQEQSYDPGTVALLTGRMLQSMGYAQSLNAGKNPEGWKVEIAKFQKDYNKAFRLAANRMSIEVFDPDSGATLFKYPFPSGYPLRTDGVLDDKTFMALDFAAAVVKGSPAIWRSMVDLG